MKTTISRYDFKDAFEKAGRGDQFSHEGLKALFDYLEEYEQETGQEMELDVIALCCEFGEFDDLEDFREQYDGGRDVFPNMDSIRGKTTVIEIPNSKRFIIANF